MTGTAYLDGVAAPLEVVLDGASLLVERQDVPTVRLRFRRVARIVVRGRVRLEPEAILAVLRAGVPVTWLGGDGLPVGIALPSSPRRSDLPALLDEVGQEHDWPDRLQAFLAAEERRAIMRLVGRLAVHQGDLRPEAVQRRLAQFLDVRAAPPCPWPGEVIRRRLLALVEARLVGTLLAEGLGARFQNPRYPTRDLRTPLLAVIGLEIWPVALRLAAYLRDHADKHGNDTLRQRRLVRQLEARADEIDRRTAELLGRLRRTILEILS